MTKWQEVKLGDICEVTTGKRPPQKQDIETSEYNIPVYGGNGIAWYTKEILIDYPVILTGRVGTIGTIYKVEKPCWVSDNALILKPIDVDFDYIYYALKLIDFTILNRGSTQPLITQTDVKNLTITVPPAEVQRKIAGVLSALDDKIELNNKINQNLELQAQALILDYIQHTEEKIPLGNLITFTNGFAFKSSDYLPSGTYKIITIKNVQDGSVDSQGVSCLDNLPEKLSKDCCLSVGDVLLSLTGNVGRVGIVTEENLLLNQRVAKINSKDSNLLPFVYFYMRLPAMKTEMENISKGTAQQNLSPVETLKLEISFDREKATELSQTLKTFYDELIFNTIQKQNLTALRDTLLPKLMSDEINVDNVDISEQKDSP